MTCGFALQRKLSESRFQIEKRQYLTHRFSDVYLKGNSCESNIPLLTNRKGLQRDQQPEVHIPANISSWTFRAKNFRDGSSLESFISSIAKLEYF